MLNNDIKTIADAIMDCDIVGAGTYPAGDSNLEDNQIVIKLVGEKKYFKITIEEFNNLNYEHCNYCCGDVDTRDYLLSNGSEGAYIDGNGNLTGDDQLYFENKKISYCPMCSRKL